jgi:hypothetical protein
VFGNGEYVGLGSKLGGAYAIGNEALMAGDPRVKFTKWLEKMSFNVIVKEVLIFTEHFVLE